jgi:hypothetical protein
MTNYFELCTRECKMLTQLRPRADSGFSQCQIESTNVAGPLERFLGPFAEKILGQTVCYFPEYSFHVVLHVIVNHALVILTTVIQICNLHM